MPTISPSLLRHAFMLYAIFSLGSMATMSIAATILAVVILLPYISHILKKEVPLKYGSFETESEGQSQKILSDEKVSKRKAHGWAFLAKEGAPHFPGISKFFGFAHSNKNLRLYLHLSLLLSAACFLSLITAKLFPLSYGGRGVQVHLLRDLLKLWYLFWPILLTAGLRKLSAADRYTVLKTWIGAFGLLSLIGIFQYFTGWPRPQPIPGQPGFYHATLFLGHHLSVASIFIFPFFAVLEWAVLAWATLEWSRRPLLPFLIALTGFTTLFLTYSRMLWLALPIGISLWALYTLAQKLPKKQRLQSGLAISTLVTILLVVLFFCASQVPFVRNRIYASIGITNRLNLWQANLEFLKQRPLTGAGWHHNLELSGYYLLHRAHHNNQDNQGNNQPAEVFSGHAHNNLLDLLGGTGILGALAWLSWNAGVFWLLIQKSKNIRQNGALEDRLARGMLFAFLVFHLNGLTQLNFWEGKVEHQLAWIIAWALL